MSPAATALQFPHPDLVGNDLVETEWGEEEQLAASAAMAGQPERRREALEKGLRIGQADGSPTSLATLKAEVAMVVAGGRGAGPAWPTGVGPLDEALGGGVPRGRVTEVVGPLGAGKTALVRQLVARVLTSGGWVAWVDATRTLAPQEFAGLGERLVVVRPRDHTRGAWCADLLLRSGVFALVVLDGAPLLSRTLGVRLSQLARERDAAFVVLREGTQGSRLGGAVRLQLRPVSSVQTQKHAPMQSQTPMQAQKHSQTQKYLQSPMQTPQPSPMQAQSYSQTQSQSQSQSRNRNHAAPIHAATPTTARPAVANERKFSVLVEKGGSYRTVEVTCAIVVARRVCADTEIPDRRGVARRTRAVSGTGSDHAQAGHTTASESIHAAVVQYGAESLSTTDAKSGITSGTTSSATNAGGHATGAAVSRKQSNDGAWTGRGRPRMAESSFGRSTRRGKARQFLSTRQPQHTGDHAEYHGNYQPRKRSPEAEQQSQGRRESRRQSQRALQQYARSLG